ncbi:hypothetical protein UXO62_03620 [Enterobacter cloacae]|uniref:AbiTii domain-containing protein n=1 Tax=Enterobacter cloacae TaxID=550 RepID=UPI002FD12A5D
MVKIDEIINDLTSGSSGLTDALLKTKVLLYTIGKKDLAFWVDNELKGYLNTEDLPDYRIVTARVLINANNMVNFYKAVELYLVHFDEKDYEEATTSCIKLPISQIERLLEESEGEHFFSESIPVALARHYAPEIDPSYHITKIYKQIALHNLTAIINQVRTRLLDFMLELSSQLDITDGENLSDKANKIDTQSLFAHAIFGSNAIINIGNNNNTSISYVIEKNNFPMLKEHLTQHGIKEQDIDELQVALTSDEKISKPHDKSFGPNVSKWFTGMLSKAETNSWAVGVNVASTLLTTSLSQYLGLTP